MSVNAKSTEHWGLAAVIISRSVRCRRCESLAIVYIMYILHFTSVTPVSIRERCLRLLLRTLIPYDSGQITSTKTQIALHHAAKDTQPAGRNLKITTPISAQNALRQHA